MGFLSRLFGAEKRDATPTVPDFYLAPYLPLLPQGMLTSQFTSPEQAVSVLAVAARCVSLIAEGLASLPLTVYRRRPDGSREPVEFPVLHRLLNDAPNDRMSAFELRELLGRDLCTHGNAYARIVRDGRGAVSALHYLAHGSTGVERLVNGRLRYRYSDPFTGRAEVFLEDEILHLRHMSKDGILGVSPLVRAGGAVNLAMAQAELAQAQVERGFVPDLSVETDGAFPTGEMADTAFGRVKNQITERLRKMRREPTVLLLEAGLKAKPLAAPGREQQFFEARVLSLEDVARIYGVPLSVVGLGKNASYGSLTEESRALRQNCFSPWARRIEAQLQLSLLSEEARRTITLEHDLSGLERGDLKARLEAYQIGVNSEIWSPNECRVWEGMPRREGGDTFRNPAVSQPAATEGQRETPT